jgi:hypothetical protein
MKLLFCILAFVWVGDYATAWPNQYHDYQHRYSRYRRGYFQYERNGSEYRQPFYYAPMQPQTYYGGCILQW